MKLFTNRKLMNHFFMKGIVAVCGHTVDTKGSKRKA